MKKIYSLVAVLAATLSANAQTPLNTNGSLENWPTASTEPTGWYITSLLTNNKVQRGTTDSQDGNYHLIINSPISGNNTPTINDIAATENTLYTMTYWYKTETGAQYKHWIQFRGADGPINGYTGEAQLPNGVYLPAASEWTQMTVAFTTPPGTTTIRPGFRNYTGAKVYIDNANIYLGATASTIKNNIEGLKVYPNPTTEIVNITSNEIGTKNISIYNMLGKKVLETSTEEAVNVSTLTPGVYIMNISQDGKNASEKLIIK